ncbi:MAG: HNH endonuclease [Phycisphaerae bacterium]|nr:HNH endonuclease [Phycisphaerae bacterium]
MPRKPARHAPPHCVGKLARLRAHGLPRGSAAARGYGERWRRLARMQLMRQPLCADPFGVHEGRPVAGEHVDHIVPRRAGGTDTLENLQTLCASCHSRKTVWCDGGFGRTRCVQSEFNQDVPTLDDALPEGVGRSFSVG